MHPNWLNACHFEVCQQWGLLCSKSNTVTPEASSAPSERLFSGEKLVLETKRNRLGDENFEKLLLLSF